MGNEPESVLKSELLSPIEELANSVRDLSDRCDSKRQILLHQAPAAPSGRRVFILPPV
jgi:hypothetical protein